jgi:hypothetical protein
MLQDNENQLKSHEINQILPGLGMLFHFFKKGQKGGLATVMTFFCVFVDKL